MYVRTSEESKIVKKVRLEGQKRAKEEVKKKWKMGGWRRRKGRAGKRRKVEDSKGKRKEKKEC